MIFRIYCCNCRAHLYNYTGDFEGQIEPAQFTPTREAYPHPRAGGPLMCPQCSHRWHMLKTNGSIVMLTDKGIRPIPPTGPKRIYTYPKEVARYVEPHNSELNTDYKE